MTLRPTHRIRRILPEFLTVLILFLILGQTTATPALAVPSDVAGISNAGLNSIAGEALQSPQNLPYNRDSLCGLIDKENDDDPQGRPAPAHAVGHFIFDHSGATNRNSRSRLFAVTPVDTYRLTAIYMLTERFRL